MSETTESLTAEDARLIKRGLYVKYKEILRSILFLIYLKSEEKDSLWEINYEIKEKIDNCLMIYLISKLSEKGFLVIPTGNIINVSWYDKQSSIQY